MCYELQASQNRKKLKVVNAHITNNQDINHNQSKLASVSLLLFESLIFRFR